MSPKVMLQYLVPHKLPTRFMYAVARWRFRPFKNALIRFIVKAYGVDMSEAANPDVESYEHFDAFFTRALKPGVRVPDPDPDAVLMPADGRISRVGPITDGMIVQAKAHDYSVARFVGEESAVQTYRDGTFATIYLSPRDYHRAHTPLPGRVVRTLHVPGKLFSVAPFTVDAVPELFARNERLVCHLECAHGPMVVAMVGAMLVSGVETVWGGVEIPPYAKAPVAKDLSGKDVQLPRFGELGRFHFGSTVVVLLPRGFELAPGLEQGRAVRVGERLATRVKS